MAHSWFSTFDTNNNGAIEFSEYVVVLASRTIHDVKAKARMAFDLFDEDGDEQISLQEAAKLIFSILHSQYDDWEMEELQHIADDKAALVFEFADADENGVISKSEWEKFAMEHDAAHEFLKVVDASVQGLVERPIVG